MAGSVARATVEALIRHGVCHAYTVPGESFLGLLDALGSDERVRLLSVRHESSASFMAEAEAKLTGTPALALASRGPGAANLAIGIHTAYQDQTPLVAILGQVESDMRGREGFQEVDLAAFHAPIATWTAEARRAAEVPALVEEAVLRATGPRPGPAVVSVPADFWAHPSPEDRPTPAARAVPETVVAPPGTRPEPAAALLGPLLAAARCPVAITGPALRVGRKELVAASESLGFGVYTAFRRQDAFPEDHQHYLGHLGVGTPAPVLEPLAGADLVLVLGTRLDAATSQEHAYPHPGQHLVMAGHGLTPPARAGSVTVLDVDVPELLRCLAADPPSGRGRDWRDAHDRQERATAPPVAPPDRGVHPATVVTRLRRLAPADTIVTIDAGNFGTFTQRYWRFTEPRTQLAPCNGAMGYAVPAAVAAKLTEPDRTVVAMVGDGGALMTGQEIETACRSRSPILVLVYQNGLYGTIAAHQARAHGRLSAVDIGPLDLATWARGLGADGLTLDRADQVEEILERALAIVGGGQPCVVDVRVDPDILTAERRLSQMLSPAKENR